MNLKKIVISEAQHLSTQTFADSVSFSLKSILNREVSKLINVLGKQIYINGQIDVLRTETVLSKIDPVQYKRYSATVPSSNYSATPVLRDDTLYVIPLPQRMILVVYKKGIYNLTLTICSLTNSKKDIDKVINFFMEQLKEERWGKHKESQDISTVYCNMGRFDVDGNLKLTCNGRQIMKPLEELFTTQENKDQIVNYLQRWKDSKLLFQKLGVVHKVGILLYGPPGTGKTSMAKAIAHILNTDLVTLDISNFPTKVPDLSDIPDFTDKESCVILLEDIDYLFKDVEGNQAKINALLQTLDGTNSDANFVFVATTNDLDALNPAIVRDGRFDLKIHMDNIQDEATARGMCTTCQLTEAQTDELLAGMKYPVNPAYLQNLCIKKLFSNMDSTSAARSEADEVNVTSATSKGTLVTSDERSDND